MKGNTTLNVNSTNAWDFIEHMSELMSVLSPKELPPQMLWGGPGVGKSACVRQLCTKVENDTNKKVIFHDIRLTLCNPVDLRGIPSKSNDGTRAVWLKPDMFNLDESEDVINVMLFDELTSVSPSVSVSAYQIMSDRMIGEHKIADNCYIFGAGNRLVDKSVSNKMPLALANRLTHHEFGVDLDNWKKWAREKQIDNRIIGFLNFKTDSLYDDDSASSVAFATPRTWELVDKYLKAFKDDITKSTYFIQGVIGVDLSRQFSTWLRLFDKLPNIQNIAKGKEEKVPKEIDVRYAILTSISSYVLMKKNLTALELDNIYTYISKMGVELTALGISELLKCGKPEIQEMLLESVSFTEWYDKNSKYL